MIEFIIALSNIILFAWTNNLSLGYSRITYKELEMHRTFTCLVSCTSMLYILYTH